MRRKPAFKSLILLGFVVLTPIVSRAQYGLAIRGNGELVPAHWGAVAQIVERQGLPAAMAGGSSATITMLLVESLAINPAVAGAAEAERGLRAALLLKSLQVVQNFAESEMARPRWRTLLSATRLLRDPRTHAPELMRMLESLAGSPNPDALRVFVTHELQTLQSALKSAIELGLLSPELLVFISEPLDAFVDAKTPEETQRLSRIVRFRAHEALTGLRSFGSFDAVRDANLFFRPGLVAFPQLADTIGRIADFLAGRFLDAALARQFEEFLAVCAPASGGLTWSELAAQRPECARLWTATISSYFEKENEIRRPSESRIHDRVGRHIPILAATSVLVGKAYEQALAARANYGNSLDPEFGLKVQFNPDDIRFGYWGSAADLARAQSGVVGRFRDPRGRELDLSRDEKGRRFFSLGEADWRTVLSASPAEPGLAPFVDLTTSSGERVLSAGGWSDLTPVPVLRALGFDTVYYVTRRGPESRFAQGTASRLMGFPLPPSFPEGDATDRDSLWSRLYNSENPDSSVRRSHALATHIVWTTWNDLELKGGLAPLMENGYRAPIETVGCEPKLNP